MLYFLKLVKKMEVNSLKNMMLLDSLLLYYSKMEKWLIANLEKWMRKHLNNLLNPKLTNNHAKKCIFNIGKNLCTN